MSPGFHFLRFGARQFAPLHILETRTFHFSNKGPFFSLIWILVNKSLPWVVHPYSPDPLRKKNCCLHPQSFKLVLQQNSLSNTNLCLNSLSSGIFLLAQVRVSARSGGSAARCCAWSSECWSECKCH